MNNVDVTFIWKLWCGHIFYYIFSLGKFLQVGLWGHRTHRGGSLRKGSPNGVKQAVLVFGKLPIGRRRGRKATGRELEGSLNTTEVCTKVRDRGDKIWHSSNV